MSARATCKRLLAQLPLVDGLFRRFIWSRVHCPEIEMRFLNALRPGAIDVAVDVGAALGSYCWILGRVARTVYAFEPGRLHNSYLDRVNFGASIQVIRAAVGNAINQVNLYTPGSDTQAMHSATHSERNPVLGTTNTHIERVDQITLDALLVGRLAPGRTVDALKIDVEGYELEVLEGAAKTLAMHHPLVICEIETRLNAKYCEVFRTLKKSDYLCYFCRDGAFEPLINDRMEEFQLESDLKVRLGGDYDPALNKYINNFVFQHPESRVKVIQ